MKRAAKSRAPTKLPAALRVGVFAQPRSFEAWVRFSNASGAPQSDAIKEFYLGLSAGGRKSYRDAKHYRRRKRWLA
jgi:branched-chain amino acid transport system ATP-binding protein